MFVAQRMSANPITITSNTALTDAMQIMREHKFRRMPVVDNGKLVGIITDRDLREASPSTATSLSIFELNYLLAKMQVKEIMQRKVITINAYAVIEEAALLMYNYKIGGLVVVDNDGKVIGMITETDIFKCFVDVMGLSEGKTRLTIAVEDRIGVLHEITGIFTAAGINIDSLVFYNSPDQKCNLVIRAAVKDVSELKAQLAAKGYPVQHVVQIG